VGHEMGEIRNLDGGKSGKSSAFRINKKKIHNHDLKPSHHQGGMVKVARQTWWTLASLTYLGRYVGSRLVLRTQLRIHNYIVRSMHAP
jgi:hypothetical protein